MSLFRDLNTAAIEADLSKNSFKVFNALLHQTLGYGKENDNLTDKRLGELSDVRLDRVRPAIQCVLNWGLFDRASSSEYVWNYRIGAFYLAKHAEDLRKKNAEALLQNPNAVPKKVQFFTPALPKNRANPQKTEPISENQSHTAFDLNNFIPYLQQLLQSLTPPAPVAALEANAVNTLALSVAEQLSTPLTQLTDTLSNTLSNSLESALQQALQPLQAQFSQHLEAISQLTQSFSHVLKRSACGGDNKQAETAEPPRSPANETAINTQQHGSENQTEKQTEAFSNTDRPHPSGNDTIDHYPSDNDSTDNYLSNNDTTDNYPSSNDTTDNDPSSNDSTANHHSSSNDTTDNHSSNQIHKIAIRLPDLVEHTAYSRCYKLLQQLNAEQQQDVLQVFNEMKDNNKIRKSATGLFIQLATAATQASLNLPNAKDKRGSRNPFANPHPDHPNIQYGYSQSPDGMRYK